MSVSALAKKLQLRPGHRGLLLNPPAGYAERLQPMPDGAQLVSDSHGLDFVQVFARDASELEMHAPRAIAAVRPDGLLWVCYPKGGARAGTDLNRDTLWELLSRRGLAGVTLVAIDGTWSAMRFRPVEQVGRQPVTRPGRAGVGESAPAGRAGRTGSPR